MANWYVDSSVVSSGDGSIGSPWKLISDIVWGSIIPGDSLLFRMDQEWTTAMEDVGLDINDSGSASFPITIGAATSKAAIQCLNQNYLIIENFRVKGSGGISAVFLAGTTGTLGNGFNVTVNDIDILENTGDGSSTGDNDGFDLSDSAQVIFNRITATKCHEFARSTGSNSAVSFHDTSQGVINTAAFDDCNYCISNTGSSICIINDLTAENMTVAHYAASLTATLTINRGILTFSGDGAFQTFQSQNTSSITINDSTLVFEAGTSTSTTDGFLDFNNCNITMALGRFNIRPRNGSVINLDNNTMTFSLAAGVYFESTLGTSVGLFNFTNNHMTITDGAFLVNYVNGSTASKPQFTDNTIIGLSNLTALLRTNVTAVAPNVDHNTFYNSSSGGLALQVLHTSDQGEGNRIEITNNIFQNVADVLALSGGAAGTIDYNDYFNSEDLGGANSITSDPLFTAAPNDFSLLAGSPARDTASDGTNMGAVQDVSEVDNNPQYENNHNVLYGDQNVQYTEINNTQYAGGVNEQYGKSEKFI
jgi:hypothetical protein